MSERQHTPASAAAGIEHAVRMLDGRWKLVILFHLFGGRTLRFSPRVEYHLTDWGQALCPALDGLLTWAEGQPASTTPTSLAQAKPRAAQ